MTEDRHGTAGTNTAPQDAAQTPQQQQSRQSPQSADARHNQQPMQPRPLPGQVFIRPGIDDRPDYEKTLTPEAKAALRRLAVQQKPRIPEASNERPETQAARINAGSGAPLTAAAHLDAAVPNLESAFLDLRDPMTAPDGTKPTKSQVRRLTAGFALGSLLFSVPMAALNVVLVPQFVSRLAGVNRVTDLAWISAAGIVLTFFMNAWVSVGSDHTYCPLGRRTPWIIGGTALAAIAVAIFSACDYLQVAAAFWLIAQIGYAMVAMALSAAFGERVPDKFRDRADSWRGKGLAFGQLLGIVFAVAATPHADASGWNGTTRLAIILCSLWFIVAAVAALLVAPREPSSSYLPREKVKNGDFFSQYRPPKGAPKFFVAFAARMFAVAATTGIAVYQWYLVRYGLGDSAKTLGLSGAAWTIVAMALAAFVGSFVAALLLGRIARLFDDSRIPAVIACVLFIVAAALPLLPMDRTLSLSLYSLIAGFAYVVYDGTSQELGLATLPDVRSVGRSLAAFSLTNTFGALLGVVVCAVVIVMTGAYLPIFAVAMVCMLLAGVLTLPLK